MDGEKADVLRSKESRLPAFPEPRPKLTLTSCTPAVEKKNLRIVIKNNNNNS